MTLLSLSCVLGFTVSCAWERDSDIKAIALTSAITAACGIIGAACIAGGRARRTTLGLVLPGISACWSSCATDLPVRGTRQGHDDGRRGAEPDCGNDALVFGIIASTEGNRPAMNLVPAIVHGAAQGAVSVGKSALHELG